MGRTIMFRGKSIKDDSWVYGGYYKEFDGTRFRYYVGESDCYGGNVEWYEVYCKSIGQYTGMTDPIFYTPWYEGDIMEISEPAYPIKCGVIKFDDGSWVVQGVDAEGGLINIYLCIFADRDGTHDAKCIGNVFDNLELLMEE